MIKRLEYIDSIKRFCHFINGDGTCAGVVLGRLARSVKGRLPSYAFMAYNL